MKKTTIFLSAVLCALTLLGTLSPVRANAAVKPDHSAFVNAYMPAAENPYLTAKKTKRSMVSQNRGKSSLPAAYSLRDEGLLPAVRNQGAYGICWTYATAAAAESNIIKKGLGGTSVDLSEMQFLYYAYGSPVDPLGNFTGDNCRRDDGRLLDGGNAVYANHMLARGGLADEIVMTYADGEYLQAAKYADEFAYAFNEYKLEGYRAVNVKTEPELAKECILEFGALSTAYMTDDDYYSSDDTAYYSDCYAGSTNHAIVIVGWDDDYPKENFDGNAVPENDGAWLIRNSWGEDKHDGGYFWMSYEESSLDPVCFAYDMVTSDDFDYCYQYDGGANTVGFMVFGMANVFTANTDETLKAVSAVFPSDEYVSYTAEIYLDPAGDFLINGTPVYTQSGKTKYAGMYTIELDEPVSLNAGQRFAVAVTAAASGGEDAHIGYDRDHKDNGDWFISETVYEPCEGYYIRKDGDTGERSVYGMATRGTPRIKAYTDTRGLPAPDAFEAELTGNTVSLTWSAVENAEGYEIYGGAENGDYALLGTATDTKYSLTASDENGVLLKYKVRAVKNGETGLFSRSDAVRFETNVTAVFIEAEDMSLTIGETAAPAITFDPEDANDKAVSFAADAEGVIGINADGTFTGLSEGTVTVTAVPRCGGIPFEFSVTVTGSESEKDGGAAKRFLLKMSAFFRKVVEYFVNYFKNTP